MANPDGVYVRICEYTARPEVRAEFENFYGPDGEWVQFFRRSKGFMRKEFLRDRNAENRYLSLDYFVSKSAYDDFLRDFRQEYDALDRRCDGVRDTQKEIGAFVALGSSVFRTSA